MLSIFTFFSCRAVVAHKGKVIPLSRDFTPETERQRVQLIVRITFVVFFLKSALQKCDFFFHASCIRQRSTHSFPNPHFLFISITCHVYLPRAHATLRACHVHLLFAPTTYASPVTGLP